MFDAYTVGIRMSLKDDITSGLRLITANFVSMDKTVAGAQVRLSKFHDQIDRLKHAGLMGGLLVGSGAGMLGLLKAPMDEAKKFQTEIGKFKLFGMSDAQNAEAVRFANSMNIMGVSVTENMKLITEAQGVFRESGLGGSEALFGAKLAAPMLARIQFATAGLDEESKAKMKTQSLAMLRYVEMSGGLQSPEKFNALANAGFKLIQTSGGNVNWEQLRQFKARAGVSAMNMSDEALAMMEPIIGELKGSTAGFANRTAYNRLNGIVKVPNQVAHMLAESGIWDKSKIIWNSQGGVKSFLGTDGPMTKQNSKLLSENQVEFYEKTMLPTYAKMNNGKGLDFIERARMNATVFGGTGGAEYSLIDKQLPAIHKSLEAWRKALDVDASVSVAKKTLGGKEIDFYAKYHDLMLALGKDVLPIACRGLEALIPMVKSATEWVNKNHTAVKLLTTAFIALAGGLMVKGALTLFSAALDGLGLVLGFKGIGGILGINKTAVAIEGVTTKMGLMSTGLGLMTKAFSVIAWAELGLTIAKILGLPDTDAEKGRGDVRRGDWLKASMDLPALDFLKAVGHRFGQVDWTFGSVQSNIGDKKDGFYERLHQKAVLNSDPSVMDRYVRPSGSNNSGVVQTTINLDGRKIASAMTPYIANPLSQSNYGGSLDNNLQLPMTGIR